MKLKCLIIAAFLMTGCDEVTIGNISDDVPIVNTHDTDVQISVPVGSPIYAPQSPDGDFILYNDAKYLSTVCYSNAGAWQRDFFIVNENDNYSEGYHIYSDPDCLTYSSEEVFSVGYKYDNRFEYDGGVSPDVIDPDYDPDMIRLYVTEIVNYSQNGSLVDVRYMKHNYYNTLDIYTWNSGTGTFDLEEAGLELVHLKSYDNNFFKGSWINPSDCAVDGSESTNVVKTYFDTEEWHKLTVRYLGSTCDGVFVGFDTLGREFGTWTLTDYDDSVGIEYTIAKPATEVIKNLGGDFRMIDGTLHTRYTDFSF